MWNIRIEGRNWTLVESETGEKLEAPYSNNLVLAAILNVLSSVEGQDVSGFARRICQRVRVSSQSCHKVLTGQNVYGSTLDEILLSGLPGGYEPFEQALDSVCCNRRPYIRLANWTHDVQAPGVQVLLHRRLLIDYLASRIADVMLGFYSGVYPVQDLEQGLDALLHSVQMRGSELSGVLKAEKWMDFNH